MAQYKITNQPEEIPFSEGKDAIARTIANAKNLLMCRMGEIPYDRYRGFDTRLYELPMPELRERLLPELDRVMRWEPDAEIASASCTRDENGETIITAIIEIAMSE